MCVPGHSVTVIHFPGPAADALTSEALRTGDDPGDQPCAGLGRSTRPRSV